MNICKTHLISISITNVLKKWKNSEKKSSKKSRFFIKAYIKKCAATEVLANLNLFSIILKIYYNIALGVVLEKCYTIVIYDKRKNRYIHCIQYILEFIRQKEYLNELEREPKDESRSTVSLNKHI
jgi:hypothetical protein